MSYFNNSYTHLNKHLNGGAACCRLCGQLYLGESLGSLMINLPVRAR